MLPNKIKILKVLSIVKQGLKPKNLSFIRLKKQNLNKIISIRYHHNAKKKKNHGSVKAVIEGIVFINLALAPVFIGELIQFAVTTNSSFKAYLKGMVIGVSVDDAEVMLFGDSSKIIPGYS